MQNQDQYKKKLILAPMVRVGTLPMRLLALDYGADLVYCEEIIDRKILMCQKYENELLDTTDFTLSDGTVVFRTCPREKEKLIFQIGTCDAKRALAAGKKIQDCVAGVDVNMGCPKEFSLKGGMGAALLTKPDQIKQILTTLVKGLSVPVTCKIRCLPKLEDTIELVKLIESTGVSAVGVHGRTKEERSRDPNRNSFIKAIAQNVAIPVIANGGSRAIKCRQDIHKFIEETDASSAMIARAAEWNCSVFRREGPLPVFDVLKDYLHYAFTFDNSDVNTKYCVLQMLHDRMTDTPEASECLSAKTLEDFANIWNMKKEFSEILNERKSRKSELAARSSNGEEYGVKRQKLENGSVYIELPVRFDKRLYSPNASPKQILHDWLYRNHMEMPLYKTTENPVDRTFHSQVVWDGKVYSSPFWEKSKQLAEQGAAVSLLLANGMDDGRLSEPDNETVELHRKWRQIISTDKDDVGSSELPANKPLGSESNCNSKATVESGHNDLKVKIDSSSDDR